MPHREVSDLGSQPLVHLERRGRIAVLRLRSQGDLLIPAQAQRELTHALLAAELEKQVCGIVLAGENQQYDSGPEPLRLQDCSMHIEAATKLRQLASVIEEMETPVVAALPDMALGSTLELALACHGRVAHASARLGFPDVEHGFLPGSGGTQRLPRLIGALSAMDMLVHHRVISGGKAAYLGLVDRCAVGDPVSTAIDLISGSQRRTVWRVTKRRCVLGDPMRLAERIAEFLQQSKQASNQPWMVAAIATCISASSAMRFEDGMAVEREAFVTCLRRSAARRRSIETNLMQCF